MSLIISVSDHILFEDQCILLIDKPAGLMVEPDRNGYPNLLRQVRNYVKSSIAPGEEVYAQHIHRLDRPVSGVILFAKQRSVLRNLSEQFAQRKVKKYYQALTDRSPNVCKGKLSNWLRKEKKKAIIYDQEIEFSEKVVLSYEVSETVKSRYLWSIEIHTGKYHQIRAQLAYIGCPVIGDEMYGSIVTYNKDAIALNASSLVFAHPLTNNEIRIESQIVLRSHN